MLIGVNLSLKPLKKLAIIRGYIPLTPLKKG